jgi:hypothetical protein
MTGVDAGDLFFLRKIKKCDKWHGTARHNGGVFRSVQRTLSHMANKALTQQEILERLQELNPNEGFGVRILLDNWGQTLDYPDSRREAAQQIETSQEIPELNIESITYNPFENEVQVTMK